MFTILYFKGLFRSFAIVTVLMLVAWFVTKDRTWLVTSLFEAVLAFAAFLGYRYVNKPKPFVYFIQQEPVVFRDVFIRTAQGDYVYGFMGDRAVYYLEPGTTNPARRVPKGTKEYNRMQWRPLTDEEKRRPPAL